jgi:hypothetical protein
MPTRPLILSALPHDIHAHAVHWGLARCGASPLWLHGFADPALSPPVSFECDERGLHWLGAFDPARVGSLWFRRPRHPAAEQLPHVGAADLEFVANEWKRFELNVMALADTVPNAFWVNPPERAIRAENKFVQLAAAQRCGIRFPRTLVSSDPAAIRRFVAEQGRAIYKPFQIHSWQDAAGKIHSTYTRVVTVDMLDDDASLRLCPGIFQALVDKAYDLRVNVIGDRFYAARLDSDSDGVFVDWRIASLGERIRATATALPDAIERRIRALMRELGIVFGCVDLVADHDGDLHFLEVNQAGQFLFMESDLPEQPLLRSVCALLAQGRPDYDLDRVPDDIGYAAYQDSAEHKAWWDSVSGEIRKDGRIPGVTREA